MTPTEYEIARLASIALLLFALGCIPLHFLERHQQQDNDE